MSTERKLTIAVDCDDVLVQTAKVIIDGYNKMFKANVPLEAFYGPIEAWQCGPGEKAVRRVDDVLRSGVTDKVAPDAEAVKAIEYLVRNKGHMVHLVTGRQTYMAHSTQWLVDNYFPGLFSSVEHTNYYAASDSAARRRSKGVRYAGRLARIYLLTIISNTVKWCLRLAWRMLFCLVIIRGINAKH